MRIDWPPREGQERSRPRPTRFFSMPIAERKMNFGGLTKGQPTSRLLNRFRRTAESVAPEPYFVDIDTFLCQSTSKSKKIGTVFPKAPREPNPQIDAASDKIYDYGHLWQLCRSSKNFYIPKAPRVTQSNAATCGAPLSASADVNAAQDVVLPTKRMWTLPKAPRFTGPLSFEVRPPTAQQSPRGQENDKSQQRASSARTIRPSSRFLTEFSIDEKFKPSMRHVSTPRICPVSKGACRDGTTANYVNLRVASRGAGPGSYKIRSTFYVPPIVSSNRGCKFLKLA